MEFPDYYAVLGVKPEDDLQAIYRAYRKKALENHPDRGGSHRAMVLVNEAWFVLRDPHQRAAYDRDRNGDPSSANAEEVRQAAYKAHDQAQHYPVASDNLEQWLDKIAKDFTSAQYGRTKGSSWSTPSFPTAIGSSSATVFILIGSVLGCIAGVLLGLERASSLSSARTGFFLFKSVILLTAGGAWLGRLAHQVVGHTVKLHNRQQAPDSAKRIIYCCRCNQKLLIPRIEKKITVTCQKCNTRFDYN